MPVNFTYYQVTTPFSYNTKQHEKFVFISTSLKNTWRYFYSVSHIRLMQHDSVSVILTLFCQLTTMGHVACMPTRDWHCRPTSAKVWYIPDFRPMLAVGPLANIGQKSGICHTFGLFGNNRLSRSAVCRHCRLPKWRQTLSADNWWAVWRGAWP